MKGMRISYRGTVYPWNCDHMGHMNVMWYTSKFDEASWQFLASIGLTRKFLQQSGRGLAAVEQNIIYKRELRAGDTVTVHTSIIELKEKAMILSHEMSDDESGEIAATAAITGIFISTSTRRPEVFPIAIREQASAYLAAAEPLFSERCISFSGANAGLR